MHEIKLQQGFDEGLQNRYDDPLEILCTHESLSIQPNQSLNTERLFSDESQFYLGQSSS